MIPPVTFLTIIPFYTLTGNIFTHYRLAHATHLFVRLSKVMTDYVFRRFPQHVDAIQTLGPRISALFEACCNYEEVCTWLATREQYTVASNPEELEQARELKRDLEGEIINLLEKRSDIIR